MGTYYSNKSDFASSSSSSSSIYSGTSGTAYMGSTSSYTVDPSLKVKTMLEDISTVTDKVRSEGVSHLYKQTGDASLGANMDVSTFTTSVDRTETMLAAAKRVHREVMQNIDSKFVKGVDEAYYSLNDVNGAENAYTTSTMTYDVTKTMQTYTTQYGVQNSTYTVQQHYTLSELLGDDSPIKAAQDVYNQRIASIKAMIENNDALTDEEREDLRNKSEEELMNAFYPTLQSDYQRIKTSSYKEDNKELFQFLEIGLTVVASVVVIVATAGTATPAVAAAALAANTFLIGSAAYSVATGETLISGTRLTPEERAWAAAELVATGLSAGSTKILALAKAGQLPTTAVTVVERTSPLLNAASHADDAMDVVNIGRDIATGDTQGLLLDLGLLGLSGVIRTRNGANATTATTVDAPNSTTVDVDTTVTTHNNTSADVSTSVNAHNNVNADVSTTVGSHNSATVDANTTLSVPEVDAVTTTRPSGDAPDVDVADAGGSTPGTSGRDVYGPYYDEAVQLHQENPKWYADPDEARIVAGDELKDARSAYAAAVRSGELPQGHHRQGLAFGGENTPDNIQFTGETTIRRSELEGLDLDFYHENGYGSEGAKVLKLHETESGIILFGNNPSHTEVTNFQNSVLRWQRSQGLR